MKSDYQTNRITVNRIEHTSFVGFTNKLNEMLYKIAQKYLNLFKGLPFVDWRSWNRWFSCANSDWKCHHRLQKCKVFVFVNRTWTLFGWSIGCNINGFKCTQPKKPHPWTEFSICVWRSRCPMQGDGFVIQLRVYQMSISSYHCDFFEMQLNEFDLFHEIRY